mmetsp:Transcript_12429/g.40073  ORF Transcript_12429/g.40073 Transcript_12429/m.40073 type:complete len:409 (-) Transcript_12429:230-1456(-)
MTHSIAARPASRRCRPPRLVLSPLVARDRRWRRLVRRRDGDRGGSGAPDVVRVGVGAGEEGGVRDHARPRGWAWLAEPAAAHGAARQHEVWQRAKEAGEVRGGELRRGGEARAAAGRRVGGPRGRIAADRRQRRQVEGCPAAGRADCSEGSATLARRVVVPQLGGQQRLEPDLGHRRRGCRRRLPFARRARRAVAQPLLLDLLLQLLGAAQVEEAGRAAGGGASARGRDGRRPLALLAQRRRQRPPLVLVVAVHPLERRADRHRHRRGDASRLALEPRSLPRSLPPRSLGGLPRRPQRRAAAAASLDAPAADSAAGFVLREPAEVNLARQLLRLGQVVSDVERDLLPSKLCEYIFELAGDFNRFYEACPVLGAPTAEVTASRLALCELTAAVLALNLRILGIEPLERI